jgi:hypothetical protein
MIHGEGASFKEAKKLSNIYITGKNTMGRMIPTGVPPTQWPDNTLLKR